MTRPISARRTGSPHTRSSSRRMFTAFYRDCRVVGAEPAGIESFRVALCVASKRMLALVLGLLGVSAPDSM